MIQIFLDHVLTSRIKELDETAQDPLINSRLYQVALERREFLERLHDALFGN